MNSYKIFITKSSEAAQMIFHGLPWNDGDNECVKKGSGSLTSGGTFSSEAPRMYQDKGLYYAFLEYKSKEGNPKYEIVFC